MVLTSPRSSLPFLCSPWRPLCLMWMFSASLLRRASSSTGGSGRIFAILWWRWILRPLPWRGVIHPLLQLSSAREEIRFTYVVDVLLLPELHDEAEVQHQVAGAPMPHHASKGFDTDIKNKAPIFKETQLNAFMLGNMESSYWLVRQAISIVFFFGGLRIQKCQKTSCWKR